MIPSVENVVAAHAFLARRYRVTGQVRGAAVEGALREAAERSAGRERDEPAAIFFAFARRPKICRGIWHQLPALLAVNQARAVGLRLDVSLETVARLRLDTVVDGATFEAVRDWFEKHLQPI
jgi:hypothetical protein